MNMYKATNIEQKALFKEVGIEIENREYSSEEIDTLKNVIASYLFSKSKKDFANETNKFMKIINIM